MKAFLVMSLLTTSALATMEYTSGLKPEDQKYYKNEPNQGLNQVDRIDSTVREINKLHSEIAALKAEVAAMKKDIQQLKGKN
jgi:peptidoglycan hydrolase CwlO-like protein